MAPVTSNSGNLIMNTTLTIETCTAVYGHRDWHMYRNAPSPLKPGMCSPHQQASELSTSAPWHRYRPRANDISHVHMQLDLPSVLVLQLQEQACPLSYKVAPSPRTVVNAYLAFPESG